VGEKGRYENDREDMKLWYKDLTKVYLLNFPQTLNLES